MLIDFRKLFPRYNINPKGVLHVGANIGEEAPVYNELGIERQTWVEGNRSLLPKLKENVLVGPNKAVLEFLAGEEDKDVIFHISNNAGQSSSVLELGTHRFAHPEVIYNRHEMAPMRRLDTFFERHPELIADCDFLNIDVQGYELNVLKGMGDLLKQFKWAYLEVNKEELYEGCALVQELDMYLLGFGFKRVETLWCGNTGWGDALFIKK